MTGRAAAAGQATVEVVLALPLLIGVGLAVLQLLAAGAGAELAGHAAEAGALALGQGRDARAAARGSLPGWSRGGLDVGVSGRTVSVRLRAPAVVPGLDGLLSSTASASAGP